MNSAGCVGYPGSTCSKKEEIEKGRVSKGNRCKKKRVEATEERLRKDDVVKLWKLGLVFFLDRLGVSEAWILIKAL